MNRIGIIFAMYEELEEMLKLVKLNRINKIYDLDFYECTVNNKECILVESGVGKVNASRSTQILIDNYSLDYILNIGVAGGIDNKLDVCDIVISDKLVQYDFDITAFDHPKGYIPKVGVYVECDKYLRNLALSINKDNVYSGTIATGDMFCTNIELSKKIKEEFNALAVEMEGASIGMTSYLSKIPFLVIRSISDVLGKDNLITYDKFLKKSSTEVAEFTLKIINSL